jgi:hypothetical protein
MPTLNVSLFLATVNPVLQGVFTIFLSKFEMPLYMKVVYLNKTYNFPKGRILSV